MKKKLSLIIPTYNSEKSIKRTLDAVIAQTLFENIEVIVVDDGSTDCTVNILSAYTCIYSNIIIVRNAHKGVSASRNKGIAYSTADFIGFCDADDIPDRTMYEKLVEIMDDGKFDMVGCNFFSERTNSLMGYSNDIILENHDDVLSFSCNYIGRNKKTDKVLWGSVWSNIYRRSIINCHNISFDERIEFAEDLVFTFKYLMTCNRVFISSECLYRYCCNNNSLMMSHRCNYINNMLFRRMIVIEEIEKLCISYGVKDYKERLNSAIRNYTKECIGNAFHNTDHVKREVVEEISNIVNNPVINKVFIEFHYNYKSIDLKNAILFYFIKFKKVNIIYLYYKLRLRGSLK